MKAGISGVALAAWLVAVSPTLAEESAASASSGQTVCSADGAPPIRTDEPVSLPLYCKDGKLLSFKQSGIVRYACFNPPKQAQGNAAGRKWPLLIYLHGSLTTPESLYLEGHNLLDLHDTFPLSGQADVQGFYILSPEGRRAPPGRRTAATVLSPAPDSTGMSGTGTPRRISTPRRSIISSTRRSL